MWRRDVDGAKDGRRARLFLLLILALGLFARLWQFGAVPGDLNQDEAFAAYEAWSLLTTGRDTAGYAFPVYLTAWGSGMNALESYLMLPFIALFGLKVWAIRLPQLLVALLSIPAVYGAGRRLFGERTGLLAALLLAVCPWHVLLSRWGLESNLAPGFLLFGFYFFLRSLEDSRFLPAAALMDGLALYAYATIWPAMPFLLAGRTLYCAAHGKLRFGRNLLDACLILGLLALPLLLFLAVNFGLISEIRTPYFSVPKLLYLRAGEMSPSELPQHLLHLLQMLLAQTDGLIWNSARGFSFLYLLSIPSTLTGLILTAQGSFRRSYRPEALLLMQLLAGALPGLLVQANVNRVNGLFIPLVLATAMGLSWLASQFGKWTLPAVVTLYLLFFAGFEVYYFTDFQPEAGLSFGEGLEEVLDAAAEEPGTVWVSEDVYYPQVLFFTRLPAEEFRQTVRYRNYPAAYLEAESFGRYRFGFSGPAAGEGCYILSLWDDREPFVEAGFTMESYGNFTLAVR